MEKVYELVAYEKSISPDASVIAGMDEAGRGPLAGPVVAACVVMPQHTILEGINDSKKVSEKKREVLYEKIIETAVCYGIGSASVEEIETRNILQATYLAMQRAWQTLGKANAFLLLDAIEPDKIGVQHGKKIIKGDSLCYSIAAASILAKVHRDRYMRQLDAAYPEYGFCSHKGYGSKQHIKMIQKIGPCKHHRMSFLGRILGE